MAKSETVRECPKCGSEMEAGFLLDSSYMNLLPTLWLNGPLERSFWTLVKIRGKRRLIVESHRCV